SNTPTGFSGDIMVQVAGDLEMIASPNSFIPGSGADPELPENANTAEANSGSTSNAVNPTGTPYMKLAAGEEAMRMVRGAAVVIGNGGHFLDAPTDGDITVFVGGDLTMTAQQRQSAETDIAPLAKDGEFFIDVDGNVDRDGDGMIDVGGIATDRDDAASGNIVKIGHWNFEEEDGDGQNDNTNVANRPMVEIFSENTSGSLGTGDTRNEVYRDIGSVTEAPQSGNITVVVAGDLTMMAGTTADFDNQPIYMAFAMIGHGAPGIDGRNNGLVGDGATTLSGDITVLVGNDLTMVDGSARGTIGDPGNDSNNFVMIGHGDFLRDGRGGPVTDQVIGHRNGDIAVLVGENADLSGALIGHAAPDTGGDTARDTGVSVSGRDSYFLGDTYI
ncbi:MAG: hypothetical protein KDM91_23135, partial [Verrucomicrobiae bacterium]|nr:hypothetical protein [Verrucomicrobiae bacterium]